MAHRQGYGQNFAAQGQAANLWSGAVSPSNQGGLASSLLGAVPGGTNMERLAVIAKVLGNTMQASQLQNMNFQAANSALQMQRNMAQQQGGLAGMASVPNALGAGLLGNSPAGLVGNQSANVLANANFQQQLLLQQQQQTSLLGTPPQRYQNVQPRRNNKRNNTRSRYPSGGDRGWSGNSERSWSRDRRTPESDQRSDEGRREEDDGPEVKKSRVDTTAYDPSEPTPDDDDVSNPDQVPASDIQVTIQQGGEGRTVNDDRPGQQSPEQQKIYICYACNAKCYNLRNYEAHMTGNRHRQQMLKIQEFTQMRVQQATAHMQARMKAEQHLRKIEGQGLGSTSSSGSGRHSSLSSGKSNQRKPSTKLEKRWCDTCKIHFYGPVIEHRRTKDHKTSKKATRPACHLCKVQFRSPKKMVAHCNTAGHKAKFREAQEKKKKTGQDEEWFPDNPEEMVTVDAVGCFDSDDEDLGDSKEAGEEDLSKEVFESNGEKGDLEDAEEEISRSGDIPPEDISFQSKTEEEEFSLADLPSQDIDLRQMSGPPPMVFNIQDQIQAPAKPQDEEQQVSVGVTTPASPKPEATPRGEENSTQEEMGTDAASQPQEMETLETKETQLDDEKDNLQAEAQPGAVEDCLQESSEMEVEENKQPTPAQTAESEETLQTQPQDNDNAKVLREEATQAQVQDAEDTTHDEMEASTQAQNTEDTTVLPTEETQEERETLVQTKPTTDAQVQDLENTAQGQTKEAIEAQPESVKDTTNVDASEDIQPEEAVEELVFPPYDPDCAVGQEFVIPITGYFCKLCHKFYKNEMSAIDGHCKSQLHYNNVKAELEKSTCVKDGKCVKGPTEVEPLVTLSASGVASVAGYLPMEAAGTETSHGKEVTEGQMESISSTKVWPTTTTTSNVQAYNISSLVDGPGFEVMEVQDNNSPAEDTMNIRIVNSFSLDVDTGENAHGFGHGDQIDAKELEDGTTVTDKIDCDDESGDKKLTRAGTPSLMSEIEEYLTESFDDKTSQEVPKVESNHKDAVEENIQEGTKLVDSESDSCKQGPSTPVRPTQDLHSSSPDVSSSGQVGPARRGGRKTARKSTRGGRRK
ncbi:uncharacterized protein LOC144918582 isoform X4 [Branchiostoma floridae x Branchiostoma belcheri]